MANAVEILIKAIDEATAPLKGVGASLQQLDARAGTAAKSLAGHGERLAALGSKFQDVGLKMAAAGAAILGGLGLAAKVTADFNKQISAIKAVSNESAAAMRQLRQAALDTGRDTAFSASQAANAIEELAKAGVSTREILGGALRGTVDLAAAGGVQIAEAAEVAATAMNAFGLKGKDVGHVADVMANAASASAADVSDLRLALQQAAAQASNVLLSVDDTVTALSLLANAGIKGSDAGTSLKTMLTFLVPTFKESKKTMDALGLSFFDAFGRMRPLPNIAQQLHTALSRLSAEGRIMALKNIFGTDASRAAAVFAKVGGAGFNQLRAQIVRSGGAGKAAQERMDNLAGDVERLKGSVETLAILIGDALDPFLRRLAQTAEKVVNSVAGWIQQNPALARTLILVAGAIGVVLTVVGSILVVLGTLLGSIAAISAGWAVVGGAVVAAGAAIGAAALPILAVIAVLAALAAIVVVVVRNWSKITTFFSETWQVLVIMVKEAWAGIVGFFQNLWNSIVGIFRRAVDFIMAPIRILMNAMNTVRERMEQFGILGRVGFGFATGGIGGAAFAGAQEIAAARGARGGTNVNVTRNRRQLIFNIDADSDIRTFARGLATR